MVAPTEGGFRWNGLEYPPGTMTLELDRVDSGNGLDLGVRAAGSVGIIPGGRTNRDGIGAVCRSPTLDMIWPGGTRNRLYNVRDGSRLTFPEIPCSYDADWSSLQAYQQCVGWALGEFEDAGLLDPGTQTHFRSSAIEAYQQRH